MIEILNVPGVWAGCSEISCLNCLNPRVVKFGNFLNKMKLIPWVEIISPGLWNLPICVISVIGSPGWRYWSPRVFKICELESPGWKSHSPGFWNLLISVVVKLIPRGGDFWSPRVLWDLWTRIPGVKITFPRVLKFLGYIESDPRGGDSIPPSFDDGVMRWLHLYDFAPIDVWNLFME